MTRHRLEDRRGQELRDVTLVFGRASFAVALGIGRHADGRLAEVFVSGLRPNDALEHQLRDAAILVSIALQHGVPLAEMVEAVTRDDAPGLDAGSRAATPTGALLDALATIEAGR
mgnify:CR=1 FL=1